MLDELLDELLLVPAIFTLNGYLLYEISNFGHVIGLKNKITTLDQPKKIISFLLHIYNYSNS